LTNGDHDGKICLWDTETGQVRTQTLAGRFARILFVGHSLLCVQPVSTFDEHTKRVWSVSFASAARPKQFASASDDRTGETPRVHTVCASALEVSLLLRVSAVRLWTIDNKTSTGSISSKATVCCVRYSPNDSMLAFSSAGMHAPRSVRANPAERILIEAILIVSRLLRMHADHHVHCYDLRSLKAPFAILRDHRKAVWALSFLTNEQLVSAYAYLTESPLSYV
jgi:E3 ubiquitin-protein ligase RFWD2